MTTRTEPHRDARGTMWRPLVIRFYLAMAMSCGGRVVVDDLVLCEVPAPVGGLQSCHGAIAVGEGPRRCSDLCLDTVQHEYLAVCQDGRCDCYYEGQRVCGCRDQLEGDACQPSGSCCPEPWE